MLSKKYLKILIFFYALDFYTYDSFTAKLSMFVSDKKGATLAFSALLLLSFHQPKSSFCRQWLFTGFSALNVKEAIFWQSV